MPTTLMRRAVISLRDLGLRRSLETVANHLSDLWFDVANGTDTYKRVLQSELRVESLNQSDAAPYFPTRGRAFRKALEAFQVPKEGTLVDLGSGKGKILLLAAQRGYPRVRGIEFSPDLARIADANIERMRGKLGNADVRTICTDVTTYEFAPDENVFFMFAPFGPAVMRQTMSNLQDSLDKHPRRIWIIYTSPSLLDLVTTHLAVTRTAAFAYGGHDFVLLTN
jgi:predicted RNA methylase